MKAGGDVAGQTARLEIADRAFGALQLSLVEVRGTLEHIGELLGRWCALDVGHPRGDFGDLHPETRSEILDRLDIPHAAVFHEEADRIAMRATTEAVIELLARADGEGRGFLGVE